MKKIIFLTMTMAVLSACSPKVHYQGKELEKEQIEKIKVGVHDKHDVAQILGSPTLYSMFQDDRWYYASKITETTAFLKPVTSEQNVFVVAFNENGVVSEFKHLDLNDANDVNYVGRETPTTGRDTSVLQQLFGNFGRITRSDKLRP